MTEIDRAPQFINDYLDAYRQANPDSTVPTLTYEGGWYVFRYAISGMTRACHRRAEMNQMLDNLKARISNPKPSSNWMVI